MKTSTIITAGLAALAATPTLTNGVASCPDGHFVPVSPPVTQGHGKVVNSGAVTWPVRAVGSVRRCTR